MSSFTSYEECILSQLKQNNCFKNTNLNKDKNIDDQIF
jgi:hypothetical protein